MRCSDCGKPWDQQSYNCINKAKHGREYKRKYYEEHPEKLRLYLEGRRRYNQEYDWVSYRLRHLKEIRAYARKYRDNNLEKCRKITRNWCAENIEYYHQYHKDHPEYHRRSEHNRRARKKGSDETYTDEELNALFEQQDGICPYCKKTLYLSFNDPINIEHRIPLSRGGSNGISNIVLAHQSCNYKKGSLTEEEYLFKLQAV